MQSERRNAMVQTFGRVWGGEPSLWARAQDAST